MEQDPATEARPDAAPADANAVAAYRAAVQRATARLATAPVDDLAPAFAPEPQW